MIYISLGECHGLREPRSLGGGGTGGPGLGACLGARQFSARLWLYSKFFICPCWKVFLFLLLNPFYLLFCFLVSPFPRCIRDEVTLKVGTSVHGTSVDRPSVCRSVRLLFFDLLGAIASVSLLCRTAFCVRRSYSGFMVVVCEIKEEKVGDL